MLIDRIVEGSICFRWSRKWRSPIQEAATTMMNAIASDANGVSWAKIHFNKNPIATNCTSMRAIGMTCDLKSDIAVTLEIQAMLVTGTSSQSKLMG